MVDQITPEMVEAALQERGECPNCRNYVGKCPYCYRSLGGLKAGSAKAEAALGPSAAFGMNVSTTQHLVGQFEPDPRDTRIAELEAALKHTASQLDRLARHLDSHGVRNVAEGCRGGAEDCRAALRGEGK